MRVLLVGKGGREAAIAWSLSQSPLVTSLVCAPGNPGIRSMAECVAVGSDDVAGIVALAKRTKSDLVVVGPEAPLAAGLADALASEGIKTFGPGREGARLESSKSYAKSLMARAGIATAKAIKFVRSDEAIAYADRVEGPVVVKADGLAEGKGVTVCSSPEKAKSAIRAALDEGKFGASGSAVLIEEFLKGEELSVLAFYDGATLLPMEAAQDYKPIYDGDRGPNTGGMGSYSPVPSCTPVVYARVIDEILEPLVDALRKAGVPYVGVIYGGLMLTDEGPKVIEFNSRFGDPEAQALLPRLESDLMEAIVATVERSLSGVKFRWRPEAAVTVVAASAGYPADYEVGFEISGLDQAESLTGIPVFDAGTALDDSGRVVTAGGRVLGVSALGPDLESARRLAYEAIGRIEFQGMHYRTDIARIPRIA